MAAVAAFLLIGAIPAGAATYPSGFSEVKLVEGLTIPTSVEWGPDGRMYIIEKDGRLKVAEPGSRSATTILDITSQVNHAADRGLLGLALDRDFASNRRLYLLYTYELSPMIPDGDGPMVSRLERFRVNANGTVTSEGVILGKDDEAPCPDPRNDLDCIPSDGLSHSIGTVRTAADGTLWVGSGDAAGFNEVDPLAFRTYEEQSMAGKIMHVDTNGNGLPGHPFCPADVNLDHVCTKLHSKGFRNPFRFTLQPNGDLTVGDVGWGTYEEIDLVRAAAGGRNYGWPCREGANDTTSYKDTDECLGGLGRPYTDPDHDYSRAGTGGSVLGGPTYVGDLYPAAYRGSIFFADYSGRFIRRLVANGSGGYTSVNFATAWSGIGLEEAPNGDLVSLDPGEDFGAGSGAIRRIAFGNGPPNAVARATPQYGAAPLTVQFDSSATRDPEDDPMSYSWDFDGNGTSDSTAPNPTFTYTSAGRRTVRLTATDGGGQSDFNEIRVWPGNTPPTLEVGGAQLYRGGERFRLSATTDDPEDSAPPAVGWSVRIVHADHIHPFGSYSGPTLDIDAITDHDADSHYEITVTATDSEELAARTVVRVSPETVPLRLDSSPPGARLSYAGYEIVAPRDLTSAIGFQTTVTAAEGFQSGGRSYVFERWSDGGARVHNISIPAAGSGLTAYYRDASPSAGSPGRPRDEPSPGRADKRGPTLRLLSIDPRRGRIRGTARDSGGVKKVAVALRRAARRGKCSWWLAGRKAMSATPRRCNRPSWIKAKLRRVSGGARWGVRLGKRVPKGTYRILVRGVDRTGNDSDLRAGRATLLRVKR